VLVSHQACLSAGTAYALVCRCGSARYVINSCDEDARVSVGPLGEFAHCVRREVLSIVDK
jgi:hypothetical protein